MESRRESVQLGKLAIREGLVTQEVFDACLVIYDQQGENRSLGEIMVELMFITKLQLLALQNKQRKWVGICPKCNRSFNVLTTAKDPKVNCPQCKELLRES